MWLVVVWVWLDDHFAVFTFEFGDLVDIYAPDHY